MRPSRIPTLLAFLGAALLVAYVVQFARVTPANIGRSDFTSTYVGATLLREGHRGDLYDEAVQAPLHARLIAPDTEGNLPFVNPPSAAAVAVPLTWLGLEAAYRLFALAQLGMLAGAVAMAVRAAPWPPSVGRMQRAGVGIVMLAGTGTLNLLVLGQWDGVAALGLAGAYASWRRDRRATAGALLAVAAALAKPHLALGLVALVAARRDRRLLAGAAAAAGALLLVDLAVASPAGTLGFAHAALGSSSRWHLSSMLGATGLFGSWLGDTAAAHVLAGMVTAAAVAGAAVLGMRWRERPDLLEPALAGAVALSLLAAPHLLGHDLVLLAPAAAAVTGWAAARDAVPSVNGRLLTVVLGLWLLLMVASQADLGNDAPAPPGRLVPWALLACGATALIASPGARRHVSRGVSPRPAIASPPA